MSVSRCDMLNSPNSTFPNINITKAMENLLVVANSLKNGCNNLCFYAFTFNISYKPFSYHFRHFTVVAGKSVNPNFRQCKSYKNNDIFNYWLETQNGNKNLYLHPKPVKNTFKPNSNLMSNFRYGPLIPHFYQYQSYKNNYKFTCCSKH